MTFVKRDAKRFPPITETAGFFLECSPNIFYVSIVLCITISLSDIQNTILFSYNCYMLFNFLLHSGFQVLHGCNPQFTPQNPQVNNRLRNLMTEELWFNSQNKI